MDVLVHRKTLPGALHPKALKLFIFWKEAFSSTPLNVEVDKMEIRLKKMSPRDVSGSEKETDQLRTAANVECVILRNVNAVLQLCFHFNWSKIHPGIPFSPGKDANPEPGPRSKWALVEHLINEMSKYSDLYDLQSTVNSWE